MQLQFNLLYFILLAQEDIMTISILTFLGIGILLLIATRIHNEILQFGLFPPYWRASVKNQVELYVRLSATIISKETSHAREKMKYIHSTIHAYFPDVAFDYRKSIVFTYRFPIKPKSYTKWILKRLSKADRMKLLQFLIALAAIDGSIGQKEYAFIVQIAQQIQIPIQEIDAIVDMHRKRFENQRSQTHEIKYSKRKQIEMVLRDFGLNSEATWQDVKLAYRSLAKKCHPDVYNQASDEIRRQKHHDFLELQRNYAFLEDHLS
jgi:hypothetical protein